MVDSVVMLKWPTFAFSAVSPLIGRPSIVNQNDLGSLIPTISDIFLFSILMLSLGRMFAQNNRGASESLQ